MTTTDFNARALKKVNGGELIPSFPLGVNEKGIIVDIGGTNVRLQLIGAMGPENEPCFYKTNKFASFDAVLEQYFNDRPEARSAVALSIGAAGAVDNHAVKITNAQNWPLISAEALKIAFPQLVNVCVVNDFVVIAHAITVLDKEDLDAVEGGVENPCGNIVVTGPGTGFGLALIARDPVTGKEVIAPGEAGHNLIAGLPRGILRDITDTITDLGHNGVLNRNIMTGRGMGLIYDALRVIRDDSGTLLGTLNQERGEKPLEHTDPAQVITRAKENDLHAREAITHFFAFLGRDIGSRIAETTAIGGACIAGGMMVRCHEAFAKDDPDFWNHLKSTLRKNADGFGPGNLSGKVKINIVLDELCGLTGLRRTLAYPSGLAPRSAFDINPALTV